MTATRSCWFVNVSFWISRFVARVVHTSLLWRAVNCQLRTVAYESTDSVPGVTALKCP